MNEELISNILTVLSTMKGFPSMPKMADGEGLDPLRMTYVSLLIRIPDDIGILIRNGILLRFDERPSVKNLADWAASLGPQKPFDIKQLDGPKQRPAHRPGGLKPLAAPEGGIAAFAVQALPGPAAREVIARLKEHSAQGDGPDGPAEYGLEFEYLPGSLQAGHISRTHPRMTQKACSLAAEERERKWPHCKTTVYHKDDPPRRSQQATVARELEAAA